MKKHLKIGSIGTMFGLNSQTLRDYAKWGIVIPERDEGSNYRYYSVLEVVHLIKARYLRSMGFSFSEVLKHNSPYPIKTNEITNSDVQILCLSSEEWLSKLNQHKEAVQKDISRLEIILKKISDYHQDLENISQYVGTYRIENSPGWLFLTLSNEANEMISENKALHEFQNWTAAFPFSRYAFICKQQNLSNPIKNENICRGLCIQAQDVEHCGIERSRNTQTLLSQSCIHTIVGQPLIENDTRQNATAHLLKGVVDFADTNNLEITGDAIGIWIANVQEKTSIQKYYEVWIPIKQ